MGLMSQLYQVLSEFFTFLSLTFLICKMGITTVAASQVLTRIKCDNMQKALSTLVQGRE